MRSWRLLISLALVLATMAATHAASGAAAQPCGPSRATTLAENRVARVYLEQQRNRAEATTLACVRGDAAARELDFPGGNTYAFRPPALSLRGSVVGYAIHTVPDAGDSGGPTTQVVVQDLRRAEPTLVVRADSRAELVKVGSLRVGRGGGVAWITCPEPDVQGNGLRGPTCIRAGHRDRVYKVDSGGRRRQLLDSGRTIHPGSLRIQGERISWTKSGRRKSAVLR